MLESIPGTKQYLAMQIEFLCLFGPVWWWALHANSAADLSDTMPQCSQGILKLYWKNKPSDSI